MKLKVVSNTATVIPPLVFAAAPPFAYPSGGSVDMAPLMAFLNQWAVALGIAMQAQTTQIVNAINAALAAQLNAIGAQTTSLTNVIQTESAAIQNAIHNP